MGAEVTVALITGICAIIGQWMITKNEGRKTDAKREEDKQERAVKQALREAELNNHLEMIERKLDVHNGYAEKFAAVTVHLGEIDKALVAIQKDIEYMKGV